MILEQRLKIREAEQLYLEDILDLNEALDVWMDMNDLDKIPPAKPTNPGGRGVQVDRDSAIGRLFG